MKKSLINALVPLLVFAVFTGCKKDEYEMIKIVKMISVQQMRALPVGMTKAVPAKKTGKIYIYNDYLSLMNQMKVFISTTMLIQVLR